MGSVRPLTGILGSLGHQSTEFSAVGPPTGLGVSVWQNVRLWVYASGTTMLLLLLSVEITLLSKRQGCSRSYIGSGKNSPFPSCPCSVTQCFLSIQFSPSPACCYPQLGCMWSQAWPGTAVVGRFLPLAQSSCSPLPLSPAEFRSPCSSIGVRQEQL